MRRRLVPLVLVVTALLAVVAVAARGRPLSSSSGTGSGLPATFWDYTFTTVLIFLVLAGIVTTVALVAFRREVTERKPQATRTASALAILIAVAVIVFFVGRHINLSRLIHPNQVAIPTSTNAGAHGKGGTRRAPGHVHFRWEELVIVLGLLVALGAAAAVTRSRAIAARTPRQEFAPEALAAALDESLDDLRADPDLRRVIVAAYARMEAALAAAGLPRQPAEAPLEYLERALLTLNTSADAVRKLTNLFEWAKFSHHEPEPGMRDEAVDALVAVRDELRAAGPVAA